MRAIEDEFKRLRLSRQRKWQLRKRRDRRCSICGAAARVGARCLAHLVADRERQRKHRAIKNRNRSALSYQLQRAAQRISGPKRKAAAIGLGRGGGPSRRMRARGKVSVRG